MFLLLVILALCIWPIFQNVPQYHCEDRTPKSYAEYYENHKIFYKNVHCSPCIYIHTNAPCNGKNICMQDISVKEVLNECINLIKKI